MKILICLLFGHLWPNRPGPNCAGGFRPVPPGDIHCERCGRGGWNLQGWPPNGIPPAPPFIPRAAIDVTHQIKQMERAAQARLDSQMAANLERCDRINALINEMQEIAARDEHRRANFIIFGNAMIPRKP